MRRFLAAAGWLALFLVVLPLAGLAVAAAHLPEPATFLVMYAALLATAFTLGLIPLALIRIASGWKRALAVTILMYALALAVPLTTTMARFPLYVIGCGGLPIVATTFASAFSYTVPTSESYAVRPLDTHLFCTETDARTARFHRHDP